jgi:hypothetical protein
MFSSWSIHDVGVIDLDATELPRNDREIFDAMVERVFTDPAILEAEVPGAATSVAATSAEAGASSSVALVPDATVLEQLAPGQGGDVGGLTPSVVPEAAEGVLGESAAGVESVVTAPALLIAGVILDAPPPSIAGAVESVAEVAELSSVQLAVTIEEAAPVVS